MKVHKEKNYTMVSFDINVLYDGTNLISDEFETIMIMNL